MDSPWMNCVADILSQHGLSVYRAELGYMAQRRVDDKKRPPPRAERLLGELTQLVEALPEPHLPLILAGKSMGGRLASLLAAEPDGPEILAVWALGYPFHPPGKPERLRTGHFPDLRCPLHILQGTRDPMGGQDLVDSQLSKAEFPNDRVTLRWVEDGNHDLRPRGLKKADVMPRLSSEVASAADIWLRKSGYSLQ